MRRQGYWHYENWDETVRALDRVEVADRKAREQEYKGIKWQPKSINPQEDKLVKQVNNWNESSDDRQKKIMERVQREREIIDQYENAWQKEMRKTAVGLDLLEKKTKLEKEQERLLAELQRVRAS